MHNNIDYLIVRQKKLGIKIRIQQLARKLFPNASLVSATQSFANLRNNKTKRVTIEQINILIKELDTSYEELFYS